MYILKQDIINVWYALILVLEQSRKNITCVLNIVGVCCEYVSY
jgi:hypothetical protein